MKKNIQKTAVSLPVTPEFYSLLFEKTDQGFCVIEKLPSEQGQPSNYRYLKVNPAFEHHTGLKNVVGKTIRQVVKSAEGRIVEYYDRVINTGQTVRFEDYVDELNLWMNAEVFPTTIPGTVAVLFTNVSERKCAEVALLQSKERKAFLLKLMDALREVADPVKVQAIASRLLGEHLGANQVHYGETTGDVVIISQGWGNGLPPMVGSFRQLDFGKRLTEGYQAGRIQISHNVNVDPNITEAERNVITGAGFSAYVAVPLIKNGAWVSTLAVHSIAPRKWTQHEIELVQEVAERTWDVVARARAEALLRESQERQAFLLKLSDAIRPLADPVAIQDTAIRMIGDHLHTDRAFYARMDELRQRSLVERDYVRRESISLIGEHNYADFGVAVEVMRAGKPFMANNVDEVPELQPQLENYQAMEFNSLIATPLIKGGELVACMAITSSVPRQWMQNELLLLEETAERTWAAVERANAESLLRISENSYKNEAARLRAMLSSISDAVYIGDASGITFANQAALDQLGYENYEDLNRNIEVLSEEIQSRDAVTHELILQAKLAFARALAGEHAVQNVEVLHRKSGKQRIVRSAASPVIVDEEIVAAVAINTDITEQWQLAAALQESEDRFRSFVMASSDLVFKMSPDWQYMDVMKNDKFQLNNEPDGSNWMVHYIPEKDRENVWSIINRAIIEKKMFDQEHQVLTADGQTCWLHCRALPVLNFEGEIIEWRAAGSDITMRKKAEQQLHHYNERLQQEVSERTAQLQASKNQLQSVFDTTLLQISILQAVRDEQGEVTDIEIMLVNKEHERVMGRTDLIGLHYVKEYPGMKKSVLFDLIVKTIETGEPQEAEYFYAYEGFNSWYTSMFVKLNDGVVAFTMDISARKHAEEERFQNYVLLRQSEDMARMGSWDYNVLSGTFTWSNGMYRLFNLEKGMEIKPEIYLQYATEAGRSAAERIVAHLRKGDSDFEETLEIKVEGHIKVLQLKATVIKDNEGFPVKVLGVDLDVTAMRAAEEKIRKMEAEQQMEIFRVSLSTLEEERHRISESLHNGLGQLLYGIKINFSGLSHTMDQIAFEKAKGYTNQLLTDAIKENRRISHELMPTILEDFGLKAAINDICQQLQDSVKLTCTITGFSNRLEKYLELAVYRTVQELMTNVVKHAQATNAVAMVTGSATEIKIYVSDNGRGMEASKNGKPGIGLASIRSKIKLLNGKVTIRSEATSGTVVEVIIPRVKPQVL